MSNTSGVSETTSLIDSYNEDANVNFAQDQDNDINSNNNFFCPSFDPDAPLLMISILRRKCPARYKILFLCCIWVTFQDFSDSLSAAALTKVLQDAICHAVHLGYEAGGGGNEVDPRCLDVTVQTELALIRGWKSTLEQVPGILLALPLGVFADRIGRRPVLIMSTFGVVLSDMFFKLVCWISPYLPIRLALAAPVLQIIGGGSQIGSAIIFTMVVDAFPDDERVRAFGHLLAVELASQTFGSLVGSMTMARNPWIPLTLSTLFPVASLLVGFIIPETMKMNQSEGQFPSTSIVSRIFPLPLSKHLRNQIQVIMQSVQFLWHNSNLIPLLGIFFATTMSAQSMSLILQYIANKFEWSYAKAGLLVTVANFSNTILVIFVLPRLDKALMHRYSLFPIVKDLRLCQISGIFLATGSLCIGISTSPWMLIISLIIFALGSSFIISLRSVTASLVLSRDVATLYSFQAVIMGLSALIAGPTQAMIFHWSLSLGIRWLGLPYLVASTIYTLSLIAVIFIGLRIAHSKWNGHN